MKQKNYFRVAIWVPAIILTLLLGTYAVYKFPPAKDIEQFVLLYVLASGWPACYMFAFWASRYVVGKTDAQLLRLAYWAPIVFIPFYGLFWFLYGLGNLLLGEGSDIGMMFAWVVFLPYELVLGYVFVFLTISIYKVFYEWFS